MAEMVERLGPRRERAGHDGDGSSRRGSDDENTPFAASPRQPLVAP